jgi:hypothetical protein
MEKHVVERRRAIVTQCGGKSMERQPGDVEGERLVQPQIRPSPESEDEASDDDRGRTR